MIDRVWWVWQNLEVEGPSTFLDTPPMGEGVLEKETGLGYVGVGNITAREAQSTFCGVSGDLQI
jgi:hypothetical protein